MCATCGCEGLQHEEVHHHEDHPHDHHHHHEPAPKLIELQHQVLAHNDHLAQHNRERFAASRTFALNLMSSPGAGKTSLLERTIHELGRPIQVIEGDQATTRDADRIRAAGATAIQINTGQGCHLDAAMIDRALGQLPRSEGGLLMIENVGNLVCPAMFDLGERAKVVIASVTEGDDKPLKYPQMFRAASLVVLNKIDLLAYVPFDPDRFEANLRQVNPHAPTLRLSALSGAGLNPWYEWLRRGAQA